MMSLLARQQTEFGDKIPPKVASPKPALVASGILTVRQTDGTRRASHAFVMPGLSV